MGKYIWEPQTEPVMAAVGEPCMHVTAYGVITPPSLFDRKIEVVPRNIRPLLYAGGVLICYHLSGGYIYERF